MLQLHLQLMDALRTQSPVDILSLFRVLVHSTAETLGEHAQALDRVTAADEREPTIPWFQHQLPEIVQEVLSLSAIPLTTPPPQLLDAYRTLSSHHAHHPSTDWHIIQGLVGSFRGVVVVMGGMLDWYQRPSHYYDHQAIPIVQAMRTTVHQFAVLHTTIYDAIAAWITDD
jgi:hypothetical protein